MNADLHIHSTHSDGLYPPSHIVELALARNLEIIALCDHDSVSGVPIALDAAQGSDLTIIPSVELAAVYEDKDIHVLGFGIDYLDPGLLSVLAEFQADRESRIFRMLQMLQKGGYDITLQEVQSLASGGSIGRAHLARTLVKKGFVRSVGEAFRTLIGEGMPYFVPRTQLTVASAVSLIHEFGGLATVAHPAFSGALSLLDAFADLGIDGIEAFHPDHTSADAVTVLEVAYQRDIFVTGGTDWHGDDSHGLSFGTPMVPEPYLHRLLELVC